MLNGKETYDNGKGAVETAQTGFVPSIGKAVTSLVLFALPLVAFGFSGMAAL